MDATASNTKNLSVVDELTPAERAICDLFAEGRTYVDVYRETGATSRDIWNMTKAKPAFGQAIDDARMRGADALGDRLLHIHDEILDAKRATVASNNLKFYLERRFRRVWGQSIDVVVEHKVDLAGALAAAKARVLRPMCDPTPAIDGEFVALPSAAAVEPPDSESDSAPPDGLTDIFSAP